MIVMADGARRIVRKLYIDNIPWNISSSALRRYFMQFGEVRDARVIFNKKTGFSTGYGNIEFGSDEFVQKVDSIDRHILRGNVLHIMHEK